MGRCAISHGTWPNQGIQLIAKTVTRPYYQTQKISMAEDSFLFFDPVEEDVFKK